MTKVVVNDVAVSKTDGKELIGSLVDLVNLATGPATGGARVAAQVLLAAYNGSAYPLDITQLGTLDAGNFEKALDVIRLRVTYAHEPHEFFVEGDALFQAIAKQWNL